MKSNKQGNHNKCHLSNAVLSDIQFINNLYKHCGNHDGTMLFAYLKKSPFIGQPSDTMT